MPGLGDWFDVFRCGTHTDHSGVQRTISAVDIDRAIAAYEPGSAPLVVGHPKLNAPAYGWVDEFRRLGDLVQAKASQVAPEFAAAVKAGRWKKRSIAFGPDMHFRHVGFLGAAAPAVKGLRDIVFADKEAFMEIETLEEKQPEAVPEAKPAVADPNPVHDDVNPKHDDAEVTALKGELQDMKSKLQDMKSKLLKVIDAYEAEHKKNVKASDVAFAEGLVSEGRLNGEAKGAVLEYMDDVRAKQGIEFADAEDGLIPRFKSLLNTVLSPRVEFAEVATPKAVSLVAGDSDAKDMAKLIRSYRDELAAQGVTVSASQALAHINGQNVGG